MRSPRVRGGLGASGALAHPTNRVIPGPSVRHSGARAISAFTRVGERTRNPDARTVLHSGFRVRSCGPSRNDWGSRPGMKQPLFLCTVSPSSTPGIAVHRTASLRSPMSRRSRLAGHGIASSSGMAGTSPAMTNESKCPAMTFSAPSFRGALKARTRNPDARTVLRSGFRVRSCGPSRNDEAGVFAKSLSPRHARLYAGHPRLLRAKTILT